MVDYPTEFNRGTDYYRLTMPFTRMAIPLRFIATGEGHVGRTEGQCQ